VFDEPTAFLDVPSRLLVWNMIRQLRDEGSTVIVATNMMDEAERLSERVAIVNKGKLVASETPERLKGTVTGGEVLELILNDGSEFRPEMLTKFPEVRDVKQENNKIMVFLNSGTLLLPKIVDTLSTQGCRIESVKLKEVSLEDVFLTYTGQRLE
jgi:ABC-2 type transport system ATP-binding protein